MPSKVAEQIYTIFSAPNRAAAETYLTMEVKNYQNIASPLAEWVAPFIPEGLKFFSFLDAYRRLDRTIKRRGSFTPGVRPSVHSLSIFPPPDFLLTIGIYLIQEDQR